MTRINQGDLAPGLVAMKDSLSCKYTAADALQTLNKLYVMIHKSSPEDPGSLVVRESERAAAQQEENASQSLRQTQPC
jgi:hypothetical protein